MTEPKSDCCGADVYRDKKERAGFDDNGIEYWYWGNFCSQCHKPCDVKERENASK